MVAPIGIRGPGDVESLRIANEAVGHWRTILSSLAPIIGVHGVGALYRRSLFLARADHPWLDLPAESDTMDFESLRIGLARREPAQAGEASTAMFRFFHELLASLIGASLAERLLPDGIPPNNPAPPQGTPHHD